MGSKGDETAKLRSTMQLPTVVVGRCKMRLQAERESIRPVSKFEEREPSSFSTG